MLEGAFLVLVLFTAMAAEPFEAIPITYSGTMKNILFDGKWSFETEWKQSSLNTYDYEKDHQVVLRTAHQGDFVYVFIDMLTDISIDSGQDKAVVCFDSYNDKTAAPDDNDYCFVAVLNLVDPQILQGDFEQTFINIPRPDGLEAISTVSDENDRYSGIPHPGYEFKIPTSLIGRNSEYGFYFAVYDGSSGQLFTYPSSTVSMPKYSMISAPEQWGTIYSPDKSLPEFHLPFLALLASISVIILIFRIKPFRYT